jgi:hypothetical protein
MVPCLVGFDHTGTSQGCECHGNLQEELCQRQYCTKTRKKSLKELKTKLQEGAQRRNRKLQDDSARVLCAAWCRCRQYVMIVLPGCK